MATVPWWRRDFVGVLALVVSIATATYGFRQDDRLNVAQRTQSERALLQQLRDSYQRITELQAVDPPPLERQIALALTRDLLRDLGALATGGDYLFVADSYRLAAYHEIALPLYDRALEDIEEPADRIAALRGRALSEYGVGDGRRGAESFREALTANARSGYPPGTKVNNDANTQRVWVTATALAGLCGQARTHLARFRVISRRVPASYAPRQQDLADLEEPLKSGGCLDATVRRALRPSPPRRS